MQGLEARWHSASSVGRLTFFTLKKLQQAFPTRSRSLTQIRGLGETGNHFWYAAREWTFILGARRSGEELDSWLMLWEIGVLWRERWFGNFVISFFSFLKERYGRIWWKDVVTLFEKWHGIIFDHRGVFLISYFLSFLHLTKMSTVFISFKSEYTGWIYL